MESSNSEVVTKTFCGEGDLASFTYAFTEADVHHVLCNTEKYKHVMGVVDGQEVNFIWFKDEHGG